MTLEFLHYFNFNTNLLANALADLDGGCEVCGVRQIVCWHPFHGLTTPLGNPEFAILFSHIIATETSIVIVRWLANDSIFHLLPLAY